MVHELHLVRALPLNPTKGETPYGIPQKSNSNHLKTAFTFSKKRINYAYQ